MSPTGLRALSVAVSLIACPVAVAAQTVDSTAVPLRQRASWLSDEQLLRVGDIITVVIDEVVSASERTSRIATDDRSQSTSLAAELIGTFDKSADFATGLDQSSRHDGLARHEGDLAAVVSVRVVAVEPGGLLRVRGTRSVTVDGRDQVVSLEGLVRSTDVSSSNVVSSARIADATITYKGKKIGPSKGILGRILSIFWP